MAAQAIEVAQEAAVAVAAVAIAIVVLVVGGAITDFVERGLAASIPGSVVVVV